MRGVAPHLIIRDEDASMKAAIAQILLDTTHRLCMWHIMEKVPEKVGSSIREDEHFWDRLHTCVWGSETSDGFESQWNSIIIDFALMGKEKVRFWPSNYGSSLVLALQLENQTPAVYQLCKPDRNGPRAGATAVSARSTHDDRGIGPFSFSRGPLTRAVSSHSLPFIPQPKP